MKRIVIMIKGKVGGSFTGITKEYMNKFIEGSINITYKAREGLNSFANAFDASPTYVVEGTFPQDQIPSYLECYLGALECREMKKAQESNKSKGRKVVEKGVPVVVASVIGGIGAGLAIDNVYSDDCGRNLSGELLGGGSDVVKAYQISYNGIEKERSSETNLVDWKCYDDTALFFTNFGGSGNEEDGPISGLYFIENYDFVEEGKDLDDTPKMPDEITIAMYNLSGGEHDAYFFSQSNKKEVNNKLVEVPINGDVKTNQTEYSLWFIAGTNAEDSLVYVDTDNDGKPEEIMTLLHYPFNTSTQKHSFIPNLKDEDGKNHYIKAGERSYLVNPFDKSPKSDASPAHHLHWFDGPEDYKITKEIKGEWYGVFFNEDGTLKTRRELGLDAYGNSEGTVPIENPVNEGVPVGNIEEEPYKEPTNPDSTTEPQPTESEGESSGGGSFPVIPVVGGVAAVALMVLGIIFGLRSKKV